MKNPELFHRTVGILVKSYLNDTLIHSDCAGCAVGNLIAHTNGFKVDNFNGTSWFMKDDMYYDSKEWFACFGTSKEEKIKKQISKKLFGLIKTEKEAGKYFLCTTHFYPKKATKRVKEWIKNTGYSLIELAKIEHAFEFNDMAGDFSTSERIFNSLMGVIDILSEIHEATETEAKQAKELFTLTA
jgi:hypothetical protein